MLQLAADTGARLAWVPRRAGERGAVDAGALPTLLPGGRPVADDAARVEVERVWDAPACPPAPGRDLPASWPPRPTASSAALLVGGVELADLPDPARPTRRWPRPGSWSAWRCAQSAVTEHADVVLPVAPAAEKAGRFVTGRAGGGRST